jgi:hypothetical protein
MAKTYSNYTDRVKALVRDDAVKLTDPGDFQEALTAALTDLNQNHPKLDIVEESGDAATYEWALANWVDGQSVIRAIEYPAGERIPVYLEDDEYAMVIPGSLRLLNLTPGATETLKVSYTIPWALSTAEITVPERHFEAMCSRAAAVCCRQLAALHGQDTDSSFNGANVNNSGKLPNYLKLAKEYMQVWMDHFETRGGHESSFSIQKSFSNTASDGRKRLFH